VGPDFLALAEAASSTRAAEGLHLTQQACTAMRQLGC